MRVAPRGPRGAVNPISVIVLLAIAAAVYCVAIFSPAYLDNMDVMDAVASAYNQVGQKADDRLMADFKGRLTQIGVHREQDDSGEWVEVKGLGLGDDDVTYEHNPDNTVLVQVRYVREVRLAPTQRWVKLHFAPKKAGTPAGLK